MHNPHTQDSLKSAHQQEQRRGLHFSCMQAFSPRLQNDQEDNPRASKQSSLSIVPSEQLRRSPPVSPATSQLLSGAGTPHAEDMATCGAIGASACSQLIPQELHVLALLSHTQLLHRSSHGVLQRDSKSMTSCTIFFPQQGKIPALQRYFK